MKRHRSDGFLRRPSGRSDPQERRSCAISNRGRMFFGLARHNGRSHNAAIEHDLPLQAPPATRSSMDAASPISKGAGDRWFRAFNKNTGKLLWQARLDDLASSAPITFAANRVQYVAVTTGGGNPNEVTRQPMAPLVLGSLSLTELEVVPPRT
jgi:hypothetical protein